MKDSPVMEEIRERSGGRCERYFRHGKFTGQGTFRCNRRIAAKPHFINHAKAIGLCNYCLQWVKQYPDEAREAGLLE